MSKRVLVIDPSRTIQIVLSNSLQQAGHQVICTTPQEALGILAGLNDVPHIIFLGIDYEKTGYKVIQCVKNHVAYMNTSFIAMMSEEEKTTIQRMLSEISKQINIRYLVKPFRIQQALELVSAPT
jgi:CheY-like chemotaxis protein